MTKQSDEQAVYDEISKIVTPIFEKAAKEAKPNHTMVGDPVTTIKELSGLNIHNYRRYFIFDTKTFNPKTSMVGGRVSLLQGRNYDKEWSIDNFHKCRVTIKKVQAEVIYKYNDRDWFAIVNARSREQISALLDSFDNSCINALKEFVKIWGGKSDFKIIRKFPMKNDNKVMHEDFIDRLPQALTFETPVVKKYYKDTPIKVEFKDPEYAIQYLENSALKPFAPEIVEHLKLIYSTIKKGEESGPGQGFSPNTPQKGLARPLSLSEIKSKIHCTQDGIKYKADIDQLSENERWELAEYILQNIYQKI